MEDKIKELEERLVLVEQGMETIAVGMHYIFEFFKDMGIIVEPGEVEEE